MDNRFAMVEFQGDQLLTIFDGGTIRVAMKPLVEALGIDWRSQRHKILADAVLSKGVALITTPSEGGPQQTATLPIDLMQGWLFKLNPERVAPHARERVIAYQRECYQVLHDYWVKGAAINPRMAQASGSAVQDVIRLLDAVKREPTLAGRTVLYQMLGQACAARGIETPALDDLTPFAREDAAADALLARIDVLIAKQPEIEWHRSPELLAVRGRDLEARGILIPKPLIAAMERHPRFVGRKSVNGRDGRARHCWVFQRAGAEA